MAPPPAAWASLLHDGGTGLCAPASLQTNDWLRGCSMTLRALRCHWATGIFQFDYNLTEPPWYIWHMRSTVDRNFFMQQVGCTALDRTPSILGSVEKTANKFWLPSSKYVFWISMNKATLELFEMYYKTEQMSKGADVNGARVQGTWNYESSSSSQGREQSWDELELEYQVDWGFLNCVDMCKCLYIHVYTQLSTEGTDECMK